MITLRNRVHLFSHPKNKEPLIDFFTTLLGCTVIVAPSSLPQPILAFSFVNGSSLSVEFTEEMVDALDEKQARRGAWLELETDEPATLKEKILAAQENDQSCRSPARPMPAILGSYIVWGRGAK